MGLTTVVHFYCPEKEEPSQLEARRNSSHKRGLKRLLCQMLCPGITGTGYWGYWLGGRGAGGNFLMTSSHTQSHSHASWWHLQPAHGGLVCLFGVRRGFGGFLKNWKVKAL